MAASAFTARLVTRLCTAGVTASPKQVKGTEPPGKKQAQGPPATSRTPQCSQQGSRVRATGRGAQGEVGTGTCGIPQPPPSEGDRKSLSPAPSVVAGPSSRVCCWRTIHLSRADAAQGQEPTGAGGRAPGTLPLAGSSGRLGTACRFLESAPGQGQQGRGPRGQHLGDKLCPDTRLRPPGVTGPLPAWARAAAGSRSGHRKHTRSGPTPGSLTADSTGAGGRPPAAPAHSLREPQQCICLTGAAWGPLAAAPQ